MNNKQAAAAGCFFRPPGVCPRHFQFAANLNGSPARSTEAPTRDGVPAAGGRKRKCLIRTRQQTNVCMFVFRAMCDVYEYPFRSVTLRDHECQSGLSDHKPSPKEPKKNCGAVVLVVCNVVVSKDIFNFLLKLLPGAY